uniref:Uncharacterized protein n=1 Tax=Arundo donax TaxID=35708 RepID=A0A0A9H0P4_ARUDO
MYRSRAPSEGSTSFRPSTIHAIRQRGSESPTARASSFQTCAHSATNRDARRLLPAGAASTWSAARSAASMRYRRRRIAAARRGLIMVSGVNRANSASSDALYRGGDRGRNQDRSNRGSRERQPSRTISASALSSTVNARPSARRWLVPIVRASPPHANRTTCTDMARLASNGIWISPSDRSTSAKSTAASGTVASATTSSAPALLHATSGILVSGSRTTRPAKGKKRER